MAANPRFYAVDNHDVITFNNASGTTKQTVATGAANGSEVVALQFTSTSPATQEVIVSMTKGAKTVVLKRATLAINQGMVTATPDPLGLLQNNSNFISARNLDQNQNYYLAVPNGWVLEVAMAVTIVTGVVSVFVWQKDF